MFVDSRVRDVSSDGIDIDFGRGKIKTSTFKNFGGDAIDVSGSHIEASNLTIQDAQDKGISVGERSFFEGSNIEIDGVGIAIASKDGSRTFLRDSRIDNVRHYSYMAYVKKLLC